MQPTNLDILRSVVVNLEAEVLPQLEGPSARSSGACIRMLLNHVILRLEGEDEALDADSREKRELLASLASELRGHGDEQLEALATRLGRDAAGVTDPGSPVPTAALAAENDALKELVATAVDTIHDARGRLGDDTCDRLLAPVRGQLRAQLDRELALVTPALDGPPF